MTARRLSFAAWLCWGTAASLPFMLGRNPFPIAVALLAILAVNHAWRRSRQHGYGRRSLLRTVAIFVAVAVLFNILTVRTGDLTIFALPGWLPLIEGRVTWNAVIYGLLAVIGILGIVGAWATVGMGVRWSSMARVLPDQFVGMAVAGSSAINLVPQTAAALTDIREAAAARGYAQSGLRGARMVLTPMINVGLDRSMRLAEVLEARGFGARPAATSRTSALPDTGWMAMLAGGFTAGYGLITAVSWAAIGGLIALAGGVAILATRRADGRIHRTRYRTEPIEPADWLVINTAALVAIGCVIARNLEPNAFVYEPYPSVTMPASSVWSLLPLLGLFVPALIAPAGDRAND